MTHIYYSFSLIYAYTGMLKFLFNALNQLDGPIARDLSARLKFRIGQRRNQDLVSVMKYLTTKDLSSIEELPTSTKKTCTKKIIELYLQTFTTVQADTSNDDAMDLVHQHGEDVVNLTNDEAAASTSTTADVMMTYKSMLAKQLNEAVNKERSTAMTVSSNSDADNYVTNMQKALKHELTGFEKTPLTSVGLHLNELLLALNTIQPTSTESERNFSLAANFNTKKRARLADKSLNALQGANNAEE